MSNYGTEIISRLHQESPLHKITNQGNQVINGTIGEWLDQFDYTKIWEDTFLQTAKDGYLDIHGKEYNVLRELNETDEKYRTRIIYETILKLTLNYLHDIYGLKTYVKVEDYNPLGNQLTSDNPYLQEGGIMIVADADIRKILNKKFVIGSDVVWLTP